MTTLSGWGRYPRLDCTVRFARSERQVADCVGAAPLIARGNGRAYGDSALNAGLTLDMTGCDRLIAFDESEGMLVAEAGVLLGDVIAAFLPRGWFPAVTPGTKFVTLGGMIAADVHGKNHHKDGSFAGCVAWFDLVIADGSVRRCSRDENADLFASTLGGMGLTGVVVRAAIRLKRVESGWIRQQTLPARNLEAAIDIFERSLGWTYSVAWIDCLAQGERLGRSLVYLGEHALLQELGPAQREDRYRSGRRRSRRVPVDAPGLVLNSYSVRAFNALYYAAGKRAAGERLVDWDSYFYPLDAIGDWNRIYGKAGFAQFQCVLPLATSPVGLAELLRTISAAGRGSFLAVLKRMGPQDSVFAFPMEGYTLALDFPVSPDTLRLMRALDEIVLSHGGRFYLAKDSRLSAEVFCRSDPRIAGFEAMRAASGASGRFTSAQSQRLRIG